MIQRKQTLFLLLAVIVNIICLCLPVGKFIPEGMGVADQMFNLWIVTGSGVRDFSVWALFAILLLTCPIAIAAIFMYHNRMLQARLCLFNMLLLLGWIIVYAVFSFTRGEQATFQPMFAACLPFISLILHFLAHRGIIADERLVRSMDRIR